MTVGLCLLHLHLTDARSLQEKRKVLSRLKAHMRNQHNLAVAEVEHQDLWQRTVLALVTVANDHDSVERLLASVVQEVESRLPGEVLDSHVEYLR